MKRVAWIAWLWLSGFGAAAAVQVTGIAKLTNGMSIRWEAEPGLRYQVQSAALITGPWQARATADSPAGPGVWIDPETGQTPQQFYRLVASPGPSGEAKNLALLTGDSIPSKVSLLGEESGTIAAHGVFLASQLGAGNLHLVTTGTLAQEGPAWRYDPSPADRLEVHFLGGTNLTFYVTRMQGDFSLDAAAFLRRSHNFDFRAMVPGVSDMTFTSDVGTGSPSFQASARGSMVLSNVNYAVDLSLAGEYRFEVDSTGSSLLNDHVIRGTVTAPGYVLTANHRRRFELVGATVNSGGATRFEDATADQDWNNNTVTIGPDTYQWVDAFKQKSFKNGKPSSIDTYWKASGGVLQNGQEFGRYELRPDPLLVYLKFFLVLPDQLIELEAWSTF